MLNAGGREEDISPAGAEARAVYVRGGLVLLVDVSPAGTEARVVYMCAWGFLVATSRHMPSRCRGEGGVCVWGGLVATSRRIPRRCRSEGGV